MINAHFGTPNFVNLSKGYTCSDVPKSKKLKAFRGLANGRWDEGTTISEFRADIFYSYVTGTKIDIGQVILGVILEVGRISFARGAKPKQIIFPTLITTLLKEDEVEELANDGLRSSTMGNLNYRS
ncbi:hypothetical protein LWI28_005423 [Acer negundo]|uniref:Uncharacterized protein n=1 Tax=Acer negundo TaxID=4023 RepID=A0AAD5JIM8_ACENE|nr:hypothetical protein LWI28_005423 [Acer negundo]